MSPAPGTSLPATGPGGDAGFTLVELVVAVAVLGIVMSGLAVAMFSVLTTDAATGDRLDADRAEQLSATYFADDVQGADASGGIVLPGVVPCGATGTAVLELLGTSFDAGPTTRRTSIGYVLRDVTVNGAAAQELHRVSCTTGDPAPPGDLTVARALVAGSTSATVSADRSTVTVTLQPLHGNAFRLVGTRRTT